MEKIEFLVEPYFDAVLVKIIEKDETMYGSIIVPDTGKEKNEKGVVVAVGPGFHTVTGTFVPTTVKVDDVVVLPTMGFTKFEYDGEEYLIGSEKQVLAKIKQL